MAQRGRSKTAAKAELNKHTDRAVEGEDTHFAKKNSRHIRSCSLCSANKSSMRHLLLYDNKIHSTHTKT